MSLRTTRDELHECIALFVASYRRSAGDPSATQRAVLAAFPDATSGGHAIGLMVANRAECSEERTA